MDEDSLDELADQSLGPDVHPGLSAATLASDAEESSDGDSGGSEDTGSELSDGTDGEDEGDLEDGSGSEGSEDDDDDDDDDNDVEALVATDPQGKLEASGTCPSDDEAESCPICLNAFRDQAVGTPESCAHYFCLDCILEWSKNANSCPVDRTLFKRICIRAQFGGKVLKKVPVENTRAGEEEDDPTFCEVCGRSDREDRLLLCDGCDAGWVGTRWVLGPGFGAAGLEGQLHSGPASPFLPDADPVTEEEVSLLLVDVVPTASRLRPREGRTRAIARTRQSERVRATVNRNRMSTARSMQHVPRYLVSSLLDETIEAVASGLSTAVYQRPTTPRAPAKRRRKARRRWQGLVCTCRRSVPAAAPEPDVDVAPVPDLLGSILSGQSLLMMDSADITIHRDGSLSAKRAGRQLNLRELPDQYSAQSPAPLGPSRGKGGSSTFESFRINIPGNMAHSSRLSSPGFCHTFQPVDNKAQRKENPAPLFSLRKTKQLKSEIYDPFNPTGSDSSSAGSSPERLGPGLLPSEITRTISIGSPKAPPSQTVRCVTSYTVKTVFGAESEPSRGPSSSLLQLRGQEPAVVLMKTEESAGKEENPAPTGREEQELGDEVQETPGPREEEERTKAEARGRETDQRKQASAPGHRQTRSRTRSGSRSGDRSSRSPSPLVGEDQAKRPLAKARGSHAGGRRVQTGGRPAGGPGHRQSCWLVRRLPGDPCSHPDPHVSRRSFPFKAAQGEVTARGRIARTLGLRRPTHGACIPSVFRPADPSLGLMRADIGAASLSVFGDPYELDPFDSSEEPSASPASPLSAKRRVLSRSALRSHQPVARPVSMGLSRDTEQPPPWRKGPQEKASCPQDQAKAAVPGAPGGPAEGGALLGKEEGLCLTSVLRAKAPVKRVTWNLQEAAGGALAEDRGLRTPLHRPQQPQEEVWEPGDGGLVVHSQQAPCPEPPPAYTLPEPGFPAADPAQVYGPSLPPALVLPSSVPPYAPVSQPTVQFLLQGSLPLAGCGAALGPQPGPTELELQAGGYVLEQRLRVVELLLVGELAGAGEGHQLGLRGWHSKARGAIQEHAAGAPDCLLQHRAALVHDGHVQGPQAGLCVQAELWAGGPRQWGAGLHLRWGLPGLMGWTCVWGRRPELAPAPSPPLFHSFPGSSPVTWAWGCDLNPGASTAHESSSSPPRPAAEKAKNEEYLKKLHMQERAVEEVKLAIKPFYQKREVTKEEYKDILRKAVQKVGAGGPWV
ncbi:PREDICTED: PHD and RING finger domain-containing protein 1 [Myotis davidii]|uniref:PHD and RING finger domain-containing protein 1 n=1 Tax=Myotis davidii TaxID=225400 RepID=UPI0007673C62|nr:PREDICTED: PHD and RING finger domain-containing protein 1 [Myotis davidii]